jgi:hypothetical protein
LKTTEPHPSLLFFVLTVLGFELRTSSCVAGTLSRSPCCQLFFNRAHPKMASHHGVVGVFWGGVNRWLCWGWTPGPPTG